MYVHMYNSNSMHAGYVHISYSNEFKMKGKWNENETNTDAPGAGGAPTAAISFLPAIFIDTTYPYW